MAGEVFVPGGEMFRNPSFSLVCRLVRGSSIQTEPGDLERLGLQARSSSARHKGSSKCIGICVQQEESHLAILVSRIT